MKKRFLLISSIVIMILVSVLVSKMNSERYENYVFKEYRVQKGETSWDIAVKNVPVGMDIRQYIYYMEEDNNIEAGNIYPGMILIIRTFKEVGDNE